MGDPLDEAQGVATDRPRQVSMIGRTYLLTTEADPRDVLGLGVRRRLDKPRRVRVLAHGKPFDRGPRRNVLLEDVETGERLVRPFRGLRKVEA